MKFVQKRSYRASQTKLVISQKEKSVICIEIFLAYIRASLWESSSEAMCCHLEPSGANWVHLVLSEAIWNHLEPSETISNHLVPSGAIWSYLGHPQTPSAIWSHLELFGAIFVLCPPPTNHTTLRGRRGNKHIHAWFIISSLRQVVPRKVKSRGQPRHRIRTSPCHHVLGQAIPRLVSQETT